MRADTQSEVEDLLQAAGYWDDPSVWRYLGDNENNYSSIGNQQSEAVAALVEKIVNSVDARLINACLADYIDPTSSQAPQSIREAVARFFERKEHPDLERDGRLAKWTDDKMTSEGRLISLSATGRMPSEGRPSLSVADQGEGQTPDAFPETFMSLQRSNKLRIHFVQGKFNMGGTGALQFCGAPHRLQLIVSRRNPELLASGASGRDREWGFTVVRREAPVEGGRSSVFTYLAPVNVRSGRDGGAPSFAQSEWPIFPVADAQTRDAYGRTSPYGSLVKLYEYEWQGSRSNVVSSGGGLLRRIDLGLPELALPVRVFECRPGYKGHAGSFSTNVLGLAVRLERDKADKLEPGFPVGSIVDIEGKKVRVQVFAFKKEKSDEYRTPRQGVVFSVNGQSHATFPIDFFRRKSVGMAYLATSLLVMVDCSDIEGQMREDLFMNSRDRLRNNEIALRLESELESFLHDDATLRALRNSRRQEELADKLADSKPLASVLEDLLRHSPTLSKLFLQGVKLSSPFPLGSGGADGGSGEFAGKVYPNFFRFRALKSGQSLVRDARVDSRAHVALETDATDDYFYRDLDPGACDVFLVDTDGRTPALNWRLSGPREGAATLSLTLPEEAQTGNTLRYDIEVTDPSRIEVFHNRLTLNVRPPSQSHGGGAGRRHAANAGIGTSGGQTQLALPNIVEVSEEDWASHGFSETTALVVKHAGESEDDRSEIYDFYINVDNKYLRIAQKESREDPKLLKARFIYSQVLLGLALLQSQAAFSALPSDDGSGETEEDDMRQAVDIEKLVETTTAAIAPVLLPMLETIGALAVDDVD